MGSRKLLNLCLPHSHKMTKHLVHLRFDDVPSIRQTDRTMLQISGPVAHLGSGSAGLALHGQTGALVTRLPNGNVKRTRDAHRSLSMACSSLPARGMYRNR